MEYFLDTVGTIPKGLGFSRFGLIHVSWLLLFLTAVVVCCYYYRRFDQKNRKRFRVTMAALIALDEVFKQVCLQIGDNFDFDYLPLHLCSINIILIAIHAWKPSPMLDNFLYTVCIPGAMAALLFPTWTKLPLLNFNHIHSFTVHILLALYPIVLTFGGDIRPDVRKLPKTLGLLVGLAAGAFCINLALDTNFMYLMKAPKGTPLVLFENIFGEHLIGYPILIAAVLAVMYVPVVLLERRKRKLAAAKS